MKTIQLNKSTLKEVKQEIKECGSCLVEFIGFDRKVEVTALLSEVKPPKTQEI